MSHSTHSIHRTISIRMTSIGPSLPHTRAAVVAPHHDYSILSTQSPASLFETLSVSLVLSSASFSPHNQLAAETAASKQLGPVVVVSVPVLRSRCLTFIFIGQLFLFFLSFLLSYSERWQIEETAFVVPAASPVPTSTIPTFFYSPPQRND